MILPDEHFEHALHRGLGRALLFLRQTPHPGRFRDVVLDACLHFRGHNPQDEGSRTQYLMDAAELVGLSVTQLRDAVLGSFTGEEDTWDECQRFDLLMELGRRGDAQAREFLYDRYRRDLELDRGIFLAILPALIIEMDGAAGLVFVLKTQGQVLRAHVDRASDPDVLSGSANRLTQAVVDQVLHDLENDPDVQHLLERIEQDEARWAQERASSTSVQRPPYAVARGWAEERPQTCGRLAGWGRHATEAELRQAAEDVLQEQDADVLAALLCIFRLGRPFPLGLEALLPLLDHPDGGVIARAAFLLKQRELPGLREAALRMLRSADPDVVVEAVPLLVNTYRAEDQAALQVGLTRVLQEGDRDRTQWYLKGLKDLVNAHPRPELLAMLAGAYPEQPCSHCRDELVRVINQRGALPGWLQEEAALDANEDLRRYFQAEG